MSKSMQVHYISISAFSYPMYFKIEFPWNETPVGVPWPITKSELPLFHESKGMWQIG